MTRYSSMRERSEIALIHLVPGGAETSLCGLPKATLDPLAMGPVGTRYRPVCWECRQRLSKLGEGMSSGLSPGDSDWRHASGTFDGQARSAFSAAQQEAERRGGSFLVSGLILYEAAVAGDAFATRLCEAMGCDLDRLGQAVDAEWTSRSPYLQDRPATLVNEAFQSVASGAANTTLELRLPALLIAMLDYPDSMASRLARRLDVEPAVLARRLSEL